jgi:hypothetical protein
MFFFIEYLFHNILLVLTLVGKEEMLSEEKKRNKGMHRTVILQYDSQATHYKQDPIYVFPEMKQSSTVLNFHIHVPVSDLYISTIGPPIVGI